MKHRFALVVWLTVAWVGLWGDVSWANVAGGFVVGSLTVLCFDAPAPLGLTVHPIAVVFFVAHFFANLIHATLQVALAVMTPRPTLRPAVIAVQLKPSSRGVTLVIAASISLTPGTLVIDTRHRPEHTVLYVHVLDLGDRAETVARIERLEQLAIAAFAPPQLSRPSRPSEVL